MMPSAGCSTASTNPMSVQNLRSVFQASSGVVLTTSQRSVPPRTIRASGVALIAIPSPIRGRIAPCAARPDRGRHRVTIVVLRRSEIGRQLERRRARLRLVVDLLRHGRGLAARDGKRHRDDADRAEQRSDFRVNHAEHLRNHHRQLRFAQRGANRVVVMRGKRHQRQPQFVFDQAHFRKRPLHGDRIRLDEQLPVQRQQAIVAGARRGNVAGERRPAHLGHQLRRDVGGDGDDAVTAHQQQRQRRDVVAAVDDEITLCGRDQRLEEFAAAAEVGGRLLDADDPGNLGQAQHRIVREIGDRAARHVVQDESAGRHFRRSRESGGTGLPASACCSTARPTGRVCAPASFAQAVSSMASAVELAPVPAITGTRPRACSTAVLISRQCSSKSTVGDSPVVPTITMPDVPLAT